MTRTAIRLLSTGGDSALLTELPARALKKGVRLTLELVQ
jgi:hypothetical protein